MHTFNYFLILIIFSFVTGCRKDELQEGVLQPGIVLTFDDNYYDEWIRMLPILNKYGAKATFFISPNYPNKRGKYDLQKIRTLYEAGNEIGSHSMNHYKIEMYLKNHTLEQYYNDEVMPTLKLLDSLGIKGSSFAYPYGNNTHASDLFLENHFKKIRTVSTSVKTEKDAYVGANNIKRMNGLAISPHSFASFKIYKQAILDAKSSSGVLILVEHKPVFKVTDRFKFSYRLLDSICSFVKEQNMKFYRLEDL